MKIIVIGSPGAGKSTFSRKLQTKVKIDLFYLDMIWHRKDKTTVTTIEFDNKLKEIISRNNWIIDGNYLRTLPNRLDACDIVYFLDYPLEVCLDGASSRVNQKREDLPWLETEFDPEFKQYIIDFQITQIPEIYKLLTKYSDKKIIIFKTREEANLYLENINQND